MNINNSLDIQTIRDYIIYQEKDFIKILACKLLTKEDKYLHRILRYSNNCSYLANRLKEVFPEKEGVTKLKNYVTLNLKSKIIYRDIILQLNSTELTELLTTPKKVDFIYILKFILIIIFYIPGMLVLNFMFEIKVSPFNLSLSYQVLKAYQLAVFFYTFKAELQGELENALKQN